jgi:hypothetical protein
MPEQWKIEIFDRGNGRIAFRPDLRGAEDGDPLRAAVGDLISWTNRTDRGIRLEAVNPPDIPHFNRTVGAGQPSEFFKFDGDPIEYRCVDPPQNHKITKPDPLVS